PGPIDGCGVQDYPAACRSHLPCDRLRHEEDAREVGVDHVPPARPVDLQERRVVVDSGVIDQDVDPPVPRDRARRGVFYLGFVHDIALKQPGPTAIAGDLGDRRLEVSDSAAEDEDVGALGRECPSRGLADPAAATGDDDGPASETPAHSRAAWITSGSSSTNPCGRVSRPVRRMPITVNTTASARAEKQATVIDVCEVKLVAFSTNVWKKFL